MHKEPPSHSRLALLPAPMHGRALEISARSAVPDRPDGHRLRCLASQGARRGRPEAVQLRRVSRPAAGTLGDHSLRERAGN
jgi:hypothetical protein